MRRLPMLVLLYVVLDFANPLMPGAVRFEGGSVEFVQADRAGREVVAVTPAPPALRTRDGLRPDRVVRSSAPVPVTPRSTRREMPRVPSPRVDFSPSPTDDH